MILSVCLMTLKCVLYDSLTICVVNAIHNLFDMRHSPAIAFPNRKWTRERVHPYSATCNIFIIEIISSFISRKWYFLYYFVEVYRLLFQFNVWFNLY